MTEQHIKEQISRAYVRAVAARVGVILREHDGTDYGLDGRFCDVEYDPVRRRHGETGFGIDYQLKASVNIEPRDDKLIYDLEIKNYMDLIKTDIGTPRILIVYSMPRELNEWLEITDNEAILRRCAWWCSLRGESSTKNKRKKRIEIPASQKLTPDELMRLVKCVKEGVKI